MGRATFARLGHLAPLLLHTLTALYLHQVSVRTMKKTQSKNSSGTCACYPIKKLYDRLLGNTFKIQKYLYEYEATNTAAICGNRRMIEVEGFSQVSRFPTTQQDVKDNWDYLLTDPFAAAVLCIRHKS